MENTDVPSSSPSDTSAETASQRTLVNPVALQNCSVSCGEQSLSVLDLSYVRLVVEDNGVPLASDVPLSLDFQLDRSRFSAMARVEGHGDGWLRLGFEKIVPSAGAHLRSFLSPKRIGESIREDWRTDRMRHFHGLNESELWFDEDGGVLFGYLDNLDHCMQFIVRISDNKGPLRVGRLARKDYMDLQNIEEDFPLLSLTDREAFAKLGECRDIVTNFRPTGQIEYNLKQRLLKVMSDHLYSTSRKVEMAQPRASRMSQPSN